MERSFADALRAESSDTELRMLVNNKVTSLFAQCVLRGVKERLEDPRQYQHSLHEVPFTESCKLVVRDIGPTKFQQLIARFTSAEARCSDGFTTEEVTDVRRVIDEAKPTYETHPSFSVITERACAQVKEQFGLAEIPGHTLSLSSCRLWRRYSHVYESDVLELEINSTLKKT